MKAMLKPSELQEKLMVHLRRRSGLEERRYLGMSQVHKCPREIYLQMVDGVPFSDYGHRMAYTGYMHERDVLERLRELRVATLDRRELVADFDQRLRGHTDGAMVWGDLLEIKSVSAHRYEMVVYHGRALFEHVDQVQLYMHFGGFSWCWMIYVNRETFEHQVVRVPYNPEKAARLVVKAKRILAAVDARVMPDCECGRCGVSGGAVSGVRKGGE